MLDVEYTNACAEVLEILKYVPKQDYDKIPKNIIEILKIDRNKNFDFKYDINKTLDEQNVSKKAKIMIAIFFRDYWATEHQRQVILNHEKMERQRKELELREKYNPDNIFKNNNIVQEKVCENDKLIEYKNENVLKKILNKIKQFFDKFKKHTK